MNFSISCIPREKDFVCEIVTISRIMLRQYGRETNFYLHKVIKFFLVRLEYTNFGIKLKVLDDFI
jgi:hypothetical protein